MQINSYTTIESIAEFFGLTMTDAKYVKKILIDECRTETNDISKDDMKQIIETANLFSEENEE